MEKAEQIFPDRDNISWHHSMQAAEAGITVDSHMCSETESEVCLIEIKSISDCWIWSECNLMGQQMSI